LGAIRALVNSIGSPPDIIYTFRDGPYQTMTNGRVMTQFSKLVFATSKVRNDLLAVIKRLRQDLRARPDLTSRLGKPDEDWSLIDRENNGEENYGLYKTSTIVTFPYMRIGGGRGGGIYPLLRVQKNVTGQRFLED